MISMPRWWLLLALAVMSGAAAAGEPDDDAARRSDARKGVPERLDLSLRDLTRFVDPADLATPVRDELEEIVVNGRRPEPLPEYREIPRGVFPALYYAGTHPLDAWRILIPDPPFHGPAAHR